MSESDRAASGDAAPEDRRLRFRFSLTSDQMAWLDRESRARGVDRSHLLREVFARGVGGSPSNASASASASSDASGPEGAVLDSPDPRIAVPVGVAPAVAAPSPDPGGASAPAGAEAVVGSGSNAAGRPPSSSSPAGSPAGGLVAAEGTPAVPWLGQLAGRGAGESGRNLVVIVSDEKGRVSPVHVSSDFLQPGSRSLLASFFDAPRAFRWGVAALLALSLLFTAAYVSMAVVSSRYEFREVAFSPGRSVYYKVDRWTGTG